MEQEKTASNSLVNVATFVEPEAADDDITSGRSSTSGSSPCPSPYFQKLPPLSPRAMQSFDLDESFHRRRSQRLSDADIAPVGVGSDVSSDDSCGYLVTDRSSATLSANVDINHKRSSQNDIEFFLQVVGVFRGYVTDQIDILEERMKVAQERFENLQKEIKLNEKQTTSDETQLSDDITAISKLLYQRQATLKAKIQVRRDVRASDIRRQIDACRRTMKLLAGTLTFAKRLRDDSSETLRENSVKELKERLTQIPDLYDPEAQPGGENVQLESEFRLDVKWISDLIHTLDFVKSPDGTADDRVPIIEAARRHDDNSASSITVRWRSCVATSQSDAFQVQYSYMNRNTPVKSQLDEVRATCCTIGDLPPSCDVTVRVRRRRDDNDERGWSEAGLFVTKPLPAEFGFDDRTAHVKLTLSDDRRSVSYIGDDTDPSSPNLLKPNNKVKSSHSLLKSSPKSSNRFTFALNILGEIAFFSGRHYFEFAVNGDGWVVGVAYRSIARNSWLGSNLESWILHFNGAKREYKVRHGGESDHVVRNKDKSRELLKRVGICIDYEAGMIKFVDIDARHILHCYVIENGFREALCACANPFYHGGSLTLMSGLDVPEFVMMT